MVEPVVQEIVPVTNPVPAVIETPQPVQAVETPKVETPVAVAEPVKVEPVVVEPVKVPETVLAEALDKEIPKEVKPADVKTEVKPVEEKKVEEGKSEEPAPPPVYEAFTLPEGITPDGERMKGFTDILGQFELDTKADHAKVQELGQKAVDLYIGEVKQAAENLTKLYQKTWEQQKISWKEAFLADPEIGGNRFQTTVDSALNFIRTHGGTPEQQTEFRNAMETSGLGNHPAVIRLLANAGRAMSEGKPLAAVKPVLPPRSKTETLYGKKSSL